MRIFNKIAIFTFSVLILIISAIQVQAQVDQSIWNDNPVLNNAPSNSGHSVSNYSPGLSDYDSVTIISNLINLAMGFFGILALIMIMISAFKIKLSGGNEDNLENGKSIFWGALIGTFIMLGAFGITKFFIGTVANATGLY